MKKIHILGNGAMGCLWASYFAQSHDIIFIKPETENAEFHFVKMPDGIQIKAQITHPNKLIQPIDVLIIACKAFSAMEAIKSVTHHLTDQSIVILLQNGMGSQQAIAQAYPDLPIFACSSTEGAYKPNSTTLMHAGKGINRIGAMTSSAKEFLLASVIEKHYYQWVEDIETILWQKLIINCAINPLTVMFRCKNGELIENELALNQMKSVCHELNTLITKLNLPIPDAFDLAKSVCLSTANNFSSMYQDWKNNKKTEIYYITGYFIKTCQEHGISCPENSKVLKAIQGLNLGEAI